MRRLFLITLSILLLATIAGAQAPEQSWDNLKTLRIGEKIQVVDQKLKSQNGTFVSVSEEAISFQVGSDLLTLSRAEVLRVSAPGHSKRRRNALIGAGIGAVFGGVLMALACRGNYYEGPCFRGIAVIGASAGSAGVGAGIGAVLPAGHPTIYRAERRKDQTAP